MADRSLIRVWFPLYRETTSDASRVVDDPYGVFSCRLSTFRFLDIPNEKRFNGDLYVKRKAASRSYTLADGTVLTQSEANTDGKNEESLVPIKKRVGKKNVVLLTGKRIYPTDSKKLQKHTISFAFPKWATVLVIADALAEIIPAGKIDDEPGNNEIYPFFKISGGGSYGIMKSADATSNTDATTVVSTLKTKVQAKGGRVVEGNA